MLKSSILFTDPPRQIEPDGQLLIFWVDEEPPDPDDFKSLREYENQYKIWAETYPELNQALIHRNKRIEEMIKCNG